VPLQTTAWLVTSWYLGEKTFFFLGGPILAPCRKLFPALYYLHRTPPSASADGAILHLARARTNQRGLRSTGTSGHVSRYVAAGRLCQGQLGQVLPSAWIT